MEICEAEFVGQQIFNNIIRSNSFTHYGGYEL
jgi:hypothetical protein